MDLSLSDIKLFESLDLLDGTGATAAKERPSDGLCSGSDDVGAAAAAPAVANGNCSSAGSAGNLHHLSAFGTNQETMNGTAGGMLGGGGCGEENGDHHHSSSRSSSIGLNGGSVGRGVGGGDVDDDHDLMDGALEDDSRSLSGDSDQDCKICKYVCECALFLIYF